MKNLFYFFFIFIISSSSYSQNICHSLFKENTNKIYTEDLALVGRMNRIDSSLVFLKRLRTKEYAQVNAWNKRLNLKMKSARTKLFSGEYLGLRDQYASIFRRIESSSIMQKNLADMIQTLEQSFKATNRVDYIVGTALTQKQKDFLLTNSRTHKDGIKLLKKLKQDINSHYRILGKNFKEYEAFKQTLADLKKNAACSKICQEAMSSLNSEIGIFSKAEKTFYKDLVGNKKSIRLTEVRKSFNASSKSLVIAKKKELIYEFTTLVREKLADKIFMRRLYNYLAKFSVKTNSRFMRVFKAILDERLIDEHLEGINKIAYLDGSTKDKADLLLNEIKVNDRLSFLADFSRVDDPIVKSSFKEINDYIERANVALFDDLQIAKEIGRKMGSFFAQVPKGAYKKIALLVVTGLSVNYFLFSPNAIDSDDEGIIIEEGSLEDFEIIEIMDESILELQNIPTTDQ